MTIAHQAPLSIGFPRQECWSELSFPSPGLNKRINPGELTFLSKITIDYFIFIYKIHFCFIILEKILEDIKAVVSNSVAPWTAAHQASLSFTISQRLPKLTSIESVIPSNCLIVCRPLLLLPSIFPSIRVFSNESVLHIR